MLCCCCTGNPYGAADRVRQVEHAHTHTHLFTMSYHTQCDDGRDARTPDPVALWCVYTRLRVCLVYCVFTGCSHTDTFTSVFSQFDVTCCCLNSVVRNLLTKTQHTRVCLQLISICVQIRLWGFHTARRKFRQQIQQY